jgi:hypothetical protein
LLEYDAGGMRYADSAALMEAVVALRDLKKLDEDYERRYEDNILHDLWYGGTTKACSNMLPHSQPVKSGRD